MKRFVIALMFVAIATAFAPPVEAGPLRRLFQGVGRVAGVQRRQVTRESSADNIRVYNGPASVCGPGGCPTR